jgi:hypothetical protein
LRKQKTLEFMRHSWSFWEWTGKEMAERQGFEPWVRKRTTVFETAPFDHSGTSPQVLNNGFVQGARRVTERVRACKPITNGKTLPVGVLQAPGINAKIVAGQR